MHEKGPADFDVPGLTGRLGYSSALNRPKGRSAFRESSPTSGRIQPSFIVAVGRGVFHLGVAAGKGRMHGGKIVVADPPGADLLGPCLNVRMPEVAMFDDRDRQARFVRPDHQVDAAIRPGHHLWGCLPDCDTLDSADSFPIESIEDYSSSTLTSLIIPLKANGRCSK